MKPHFLKSIAVIAVIALTTGGGFGARATSVVPLDLDQMVAHAERNATVWAAKLAIESRCGP